LKPLLIAAGDSLTAGRYGTPYLPRIASAVKWTILNLGADGEPLRGIERNLRAGLAGHPAPDTVILEGGANDLLIPWMTRHYPKQWGPFTRKLSRHGSIAAADDSEILKLIESCLKTAGKAGAGRVILMTVPILGEQLDSPLNLRREQLNEVIREAVRENCGRNLPVFLADPARLFEKELLSRQPGSDWLFSAPGDLEKDRRILADGLPGEDLSRNRNLHLTIDGVHLNSRGAGLCTEALDRIL